MEELESKKLETGSGVLMFIPLATFESVTATGKVSVANKSKRQMFQ